MCVYSPQIGHIYILYNTPKHRLIIEIVNYGVIHILNIVEVEVEVVLTSTVSRSRGILEQVLLI